MNIFVEIIKFFIYSICIVLISKYILVKILRKLGELLNLKPRIIGNIAGIATSIPELLTVSFSAFTGLMTTSIYNIISSNIINLVQYSFSIVLQKNRKVIKNQAIQIDLVLVILTILIPITITFLNIENNVIVVPIFILLLLLFHKVSNNAHKLYIKKESKNKEDIHNNVEKSNEARIIQVITQVIILMFIGIILYVIGNLLSEVLSNLCIRLKVPETVVGILLGIVTSIPELITFFESQRYHTDEKEGVIEATSNLLTSNVMNLYIIQSIGILVYKFFK